MHSAPQRPAADEDPAHPCGVPCGDHAFDDALMCRCGVSWASHQRLPEPCILNARGRNRGAESDPPRESHG